MENVTKALIMAAGILVFVMLLSLIMIFWRSLSGYYAEQHNTQVIEQDTKFNAQFDNYSGETIRGNELISVINKIVSYNTSIADMEKYDKIILSVDFKGYQRKANDNFKYSDSDPSIFQGKISNNILKNTTASDQNLRDVASLSVDLIAEIKSVGLVVTDAQLQALSADIQNIAIDSNAAQSLQITRNQKLQNILGKETANKLTATQMEKIISVTKKYYQYTQLKRAMFKCTEVQHNSKENGRVNGMKFEIVEENGKAKFN